MTEPTAAATATSPTTESRTVVVRDGRVRWRSPEGVELPADDELVRLLDGVVMGAGPQVVEWTGRPGAPARVRVTGQELRGRHPADRARHYAISPELAPDGPRLEPDQAWRLARLEELARLGTWEWHVQEDHVVWSAALLRLFGLPPHCELDFETYRSLLHPDDVEMIEQTLAEAMRTGAPFGYTHRMFLADRRTERVFECYGEVVLQDGRPVRVLGTAQDITEQHRARNELAFLARHDPLTGLANRREITERLAACAADPRGGALLLIDVDHFKDVNDLRGHAAGDHVMRALGQRLGAAVRPGALLGRLGGDEFALILTGCTVAEAVDYAGQLCRLIAGTPIVAGGGELGVTASVGVAAVEPGSRFEVALAHADLALYQAKDAGRNRAQLFAPDHYDQAARRVSVLRRIGNALDAETMRLDAQPIVSLATGTVVGHELRARLEDGLRPPVRPAEFLPTAERTALAPRLDRWVLQQAVRALATPAARDARLRLDVNISGQSLADPGLAAWVLAILDAAGVAPDRLGLEITETAAITSLDAAGLFVATLVERGCGFALDDFGAGFGSFSRLKRLPFTAVKIAGEFVRQLDSDAVDRALVQSVVRVAHQLGMRTVATNIDRPELVDCVRALGVERAQGHPLGPSRPLGELLTDLERKDRP